MIDVCISDNTPKHSAFSLVAFELQYRSEQQYFEQLDTHTTEIGGFAETIQTNWSVYS